MATSNDADAGNVVMRHDDRPAGLRGPFRTDRLARDLYADGAGIARAVPKAVAIPLDADDLSRLIKWAREGGHSLIPRASGSGMAAGAVGPGVIVDVSRFTTIGVVDEAAQRIRVSCGAVRDDVDAAARRVGLRFPVDPSSGAFCTIGGMTATNAAGARTLKHGAMREWVTGLHCVFDDGTQVWIRRDAPLPRHVPAVHRLTRTLDAMRPLVTPLALAHTGVRKESSGYAVARALESSGHLLDLLVGSEGTLAFFTEIELALIPVAGATATLLTCFGSLDQATEAATIARELGASACELLDRTFLEVAATDRPTGVPAGTEAVLLIELEGAHADDVKHATHVLESRLRNVGATEVHTALDRNAERALWSLRHAASPILARLAPRLCSMQFIEDGCVPPPQLPAYVRGVRAALAHAEFPGVIFGHAGDAHAHVNPLVDVTRPGWRDRVHGVLDRVCELTARLGGTLSGEHGDGRLRAPLLSRVWGPEARAAFQNVKSAADPTDVLNAGCKVPLPDAEALTVLRHDPDAPPLDSRADAALRRIERERRWQTFRLDAAG